MPARPAQSGETIMRARIDAEMCTACESCVETCPEVFEMGDEVARVKTDPVPSGAEDCCREAAENCPVECIEIIEG